MLNVICIAVYFVFAIAWIYLILSAGKKYDSLLDPLDKKKYLLKPFFPVGFRILELIKYPYSSNYDRIRRAQSEIVFGERFGEYYYRINMAEKVTYAAMCLTIAPILGPLIGEPLFSLFGVAAAGVTFYYADTKITDIIKRREQEIGRDFADVVSQMALLINAGMITREAWEKIAEQGEGTLYEEMRVSVVDMRNGMPEIDAYIAFGNRCGVPLVKKFISMLVQNLTKANRELVDFLKKEAVVCWEEKKHIVRRQGEEAGNKLMIPLSMILIGIFIMILVPVLSNLGI